MINFKQFRSSFNEDDINQNVNTNNQEAQEKMNNIFSSIDSEIDKWVFDLKKTMVTPSFFQAGQAGQTGQDGQAGQTGQPMQRGIWDRFKNFLSNVRHGRYDPKNPYRWQNTLGDYLGQKVESVNPNNLSLNDYKILKTICEDLQQSLDSLPAGSENLHIIRIIDQRSAQLKRTIRDIISKSLSNGPGFGNVDEPVPGTGNVDEPVPGTGNVDEPVPVTGNVDEPGTGRMANIGEFEAARKKRGRPQGSKNKVEPESPQDTVIDPSPQDTETELQKKWSNLSKEEKAITPPPKKENDTWGTLEGNKKYWNEYGGGVSNLKSDAEILKVKKFRFKFPVIFRIGDPRTKIVKDELNIAIKISQEPETISDILNHRFEHEDEIIDFNHFNQKIERAKILDQKISEKIQSNESSKKSKEELDIKIDFWKDKINNFESELENIKDGDRDQWSREDYNEAAKIVYQKYKEKLNERFNKIENQTIKKESIENLNQEEKSPNEDFFERLNNLKKIMKDSIDSYKQELRPKIEEDDKDEFEKADSIPKLNTYYKNVIQNIPESYSIIKLKERLLFKEYNQKNIKKLNVNERTKYFKNLLKNR